MVLDIFYSAFSHSDLHSNKFLSIFFFFSQIEPTFLTLKQNKTKKTPKKLFIVNNYFSVRHPAQTSSRKQRLIPKSSKFRMKWKFWKWMPPLKILPPISSNQSREDLQEIFNEALPPNLRTYCIFFWGYYSIDWNFLGTIESSLSQLFRARYNYMLLNDHFYDIARSNI